MLSIVDECWEGAEMDVVRDMDFGSLLTWSKMMEWTSKSGLVECCSKVGGWMLGGGLMY